MNPRIKRMETHKDKTLQRTQQQQTSFSRLMGTRHYFCLEKSKLKKKKVFRNFVVANRSTFESQLTGKRFSYDAVMLCRPPPSDILSLPPPPL